MDKSRNFQRGIRPRWKDLFDTHSSSQHQLSGAGYSGKVRDKGKGFTLIEIVIVTTLAVVILLIIYDVFLVSHQAYQIGDTKLELLQNGRIVLDRLVRELRQTPDIVTELPPTKLEVGFPPPKEIQFQDGHDVSTIQYLKYFLIGNALQRQRTVYYFPEEPEIYVVWNAQNELGQPPTANILEDKIIAEYLSDLAFYGSHVVNIEVWLTKGESQEHLLTAVWGRNTRQ